MPEQIQIFISYKTGETTGLTFQARAIKKELTQRQGTNYHVWFDKDSLEAGLDWNTQIYKSIPESDILLLLLAQETAESDWVRREIDVAKGAQVTILPVLIREFDGLEKALDRFDIPRLQAVSLYEGSDDEFEKLFAAIEQRKSDTREAQQVLLRRLDRGPRHHPVVNSNASHKVYEAASKADAGQEGEGCGGIKVHLAAGSLMEMRNIDVFVNSENDYMQMARIFDDRSISSMLRFHGSHFDGANRLLEDTLQNELNDHVKYHYKTRPLGIGTVVPTNAGHEKSRLVTRNKARYVFHTAVVSVQDNGRGGKVLVPINDLDLKQAIRSALDKVTEVNKDRGIPNASTLPKTSTSQKARTSKEKADYKQIESIIFPLMGTGSGGLTVDKVAPLMTHAIKEFILDEPETSLKDIYICAYSIEDVEAVEGALEAEFGVVESDGVEGGER